MRAKVKTHHDKEKAASIEADRKNVLQTCLMQGDPASVMQRRGLG